LLLTYFSSSNHRKENSYWLGLAIHFAKDAGAHEYDTKEQSSTYHRTTLKRLWWSCILRDRVISLALHRPLQLSSEDFDFSVAAFVEGDFEDEIGKSKVYDQITKTALVQIIVSLSELTVSLTDAIMIICPRKSTPKLPAQSDLGQSYYRMDKCKTELDHWYERTSELFTRLCAIDNAHNSLKLYTNLTYIYYL
jgi:hypothetical protein